MLNLDELVRQQDNDSLNRPIRKFVIGSPSTEYFHRIEDEKKRTAFIMFLCRQNISVIARVIDVSRPTVYSYLAEGFDVYPEFKCVV